MTQNAEKTRLNYTPPDEVEEAMQLLIRETFNRDMVLLTRGQALATFVMRGVRDWKASRLKAAEEAAKKSVNVDDAGEPLSQSTLRLAEGMRRNKEAQDKLRK